VPLLGTGARGATEPWLEVLSKGAFLSVTLFEASVLNVLAESIASAIAAHRCQRLVRAPFRRISEVSFFAR
jgi:hypothetical protein